MQYDYLIVGAGLSGAVFARELTNSGKSCLVIDKRNHIAGNVHTRNIEGINVHAYGPHIFHTSSDQIWHYVNQYASFNNYINCPIANYKGEIYNLPFNMNTFSKLWGITSPQQAQAIIQAQTGVASGREANNLEEQAIKLVGTDVYEKLIKGYTEKQWGRACCELPAFIIQRLPVRFTYNNNYFDDVYQGIPLGGYTQMIGKMLDGIDIKLGVDYFSSMREMRKLADKLIFTGSIDAYYNYCFGMLEYRSLRFENEILDTVNYQGNAVVNYTDSDTPYTRIIEHKHFEFGNQPRTVISREYSMEWKQGAEPYYPINDASNSLLYQKYCAIAAADQKVIFGGRLGCYQYFDMDDIIQKTLMQCRSEIDG